MALFKIFKGTDADFLSINGKNLNSIDADGQATSLSASTKDKHPGWAYVTKTAQGDPNGAYTYGNFYVDYDESTRLKVGAHADIADIATNAINDADGNVIDQNYGATLILNDHTVTLKSKSGAELSSVTIPDNNTTYSAGAGISLKDTIFSNSGVRRITTGDDNGTIKVNTGGTSTNVLIKGLSSAAYHAASDFAEAGHTHTFSDIIDSGGAGIDSFTIAKATDSTLVATIGAGGTNFSQTIPYANANDPGIVRSDGVLQSFYGRKNFTNTANYVPLEVSSYGYKRTYNGSTNYTSENDYTSVISMMRVWGGPVTQVSGTTDASGTAATFPGTLGACLALGNDNAYASAGKLRGVLRLYSYGTGYVDIYPAYNQSGNTTITLPKNSGRLVLREESTAFSGNNTFAGTSTFNNLVTIASAYYPKFNLDATATNSLGTKSRATFQGDYTDNVAMWIYSDSTTTVNSRRGLVLKGYALQSDDKKSLVLRRCNTSGTWESDWVILHEGNYSGYCLPLAGGILTGGIRVHSTGSGTGYVQNSAVAIQVREAGLVGSTQSDYNYAPKIGFYWSGRCARTLGMNASGEFCFCSQDTNDATATVRAGKVYGAVWNDYAEYRKADTIEPGRVISENGDDTLSLSSQRLQRGCEIISDTFGFAIGETDDCKTPIAASGRVLAYPYEDREEFKKYIGWPVCSGPNGTVSIMTEEEEERYPSRIIGTISAVPDYKEWGTNNIKVNGRVWIRIK